MRFLAALLAALAAFAQSVAVVEGNPKSVVRVVAYENLQCSDCTVYRQMMDQRLLPTYASRVAFEHRDFPLPKHKWARPAAIAGRHFDSIDPKLGVEFRRWAFANQSSITAENFRERLAGWAKANGSDPAKAVASLDDAKLAKLVDDDYAEGIARGVARTPTVFVNGEPFIETFTAEEISRAIDAALKAARPE